MMKILANISGLISISFLLCCNVPAIKKNKESTKEETEKEQKLPIAKKGKDGYVKNYNGENNKLFSFVGQKISIEEIPQKIDSKTFIVDREFKAKYLIVQKVFGNFSQDTIEFIVYAHKGVPKFSNYDNALLFVSAHSGTYYHEKYMYNDVYPTKDGKWAGSYAVDDYLNENNIDTKVKPVMIDFLEEVSYPKSAITNLSHLQSFDYIQQCFRVIGDKAIVVYGNYVEDLFILKRDGYLTARGIFKNGKLQ